jgi:hypothetical protein
MPRRGPRATRSIWNAIAVLAVVLVLGFVAAGYEIHHLQTEVNSLQSQVNTMGKGVAQLYALLTQGKAPK